MRNPLFLTLIALSATLPLQAQMTLVDTSAQQILFDSFTAPNPWTNSGGTGGALDWNTWAFSTGTRTSVAAVFGESLGTGRGASNGGVSDNGIYAFTVAPGVPAWGFQATGTFGSPGSLTLAVRNDTGAVLPGLSVSYTAWFLNDAPRSGVLRPYYSLTNDGSADSYLPADGDLQDIASPAVADGTPVWTSADRAYVLPDLNLAVGQTVFLRWGFNDSGSGTRDEWAVSTITVQAIPEPATMAALLGVLTLLAATRRRTRL